MKIYGNMDWFNVAEQPSSLDDLPPAFQQAYTAWLDNGRESNPEVIGLLAKFVSARFVAENIWDWEEIFDGSTEGIFECDKVSVAGFDFEEQPIPLCKAEAWFTLKPNEGVSESDIEQFLEDNDVDLAECLIFYWSLEDIENLEDLDLTVGEHRGADVLPPYNSTVFDIIP